MFERLISILVAAGCCRQTLTETFFYLQGSTLEVGKQEKSDRSRFLDHSSPISRSPTSEMTFQGVTVFAEQSGYSSDGSSLALGNCLGSVLQDELDDPGWIFQRMWMVSDSRLTDDLNLIHSDGIDALVGTLLLC